MKKILLLVIITVVAIGTILGVTFLLGHEEDKKGQIMQSKENNVTTTDGGLSIVVTYNNNRYDRRLTTAWGFSCLIRGTEKTILFDTGGDGSILLANMGKLGINPKEIDLIVLSHIHSDHVGGLHSILEKNPKVVVYLPESFPMSFKSNVIEYGAKVVEVHEPLKICDSVYSTGEFGTWIKEQSLVVQTGKGLIVITGCAHPGIVKVVSKSKDLVKDNVLLAMGGFHLFGQSKGNIEKIISSLRKLGVRYVGPCHCSGDLSRQLFEKEYRGNYINIGVGRVITMSDFK